MRRGRKQDMEV